LLKLLLKEHSMVYQEEGGLLLACSSVKWNSAEGKASVRRVMGFGFESRPAGGFSSGRFGQGGKESKYAACPNPPEENWQYRSQA
jgi:hypothetical protein